MMDKNELIPRNKFDYKSVEKLKKENKETIVQVLPQLLESLQDMNWPIAQDIEDLLIDYGHLLIPHIRAVLNSNDGGWKWSLLYGLINRLSTQELSELRTDLERMKYHPTQDEVDEELTGKIDELLAKFL
ncbi:DUF5071 domain-containing protein [Paenibacillus sp. sptzw28]|uniref:DUF5071 domain-containing protein n=1 Tax=Paenibacillus sp. sptzw28 TaxID=715179 RepID=UPI001C6ED0B9|nr:DUF5071 domain-containing protein [Paenibacillus sp. sptzw28]QYR23583.1 DUF5071 domain-containing protein [Paenibacillus sp. sptzw28]